MSDEQTTTFRAAVMDDCTCTAHGNPWFCHVRTCPVRIGSVRVAAS